MEQVRWGMRVHGRNGLERGWNHDLALWPDPNPNPSPVGPTLTAQICASYFAAADLSSLIGVSGTLSCTTAAS